MRVKSEGREKALDLGGKGRRWAERMKVVHTQYKDKVDVM